MRLGNTIRRRRKKLRISQQELANDNWSRSYISQIESNRVQPSLENLSIIANKLDTTISDLIGDQLLLEKAKATIFYPTICKKYLAQLPETPTTIFLYQLTNSLQTNNYLNYQIPPSAELYYLTARVHIFQQNYDKALQVLLDGQKFLDSYWKILFLTKICQVYDKLAKKEELNAAQEQLRNLLKSIHSIDELRNIIASELQYESDPARSRHLISLLQAIDFHQDLSQIPKNNIDDLF